MRSGICIRDGIDRCVCSWALCMVVIAGTAAADEAVESNGQHRHEGADRHMHQRSFDDLVERFEDPERAAWQKPEAVIAALGALDGKTVADIGAGTGYFAFPIAEKARSVIAIDIDQRMLDHIRGRMDQGDAGSNIEPRLAAPDDPCLKPGEADAVLIVNTYHHIEDRVDYLKHVTAGLQPDGQLTIVEFHKKELPVGPPPAMKLEPDQVRRELEEAGFRSISVDTATLPYQYIVTATRK